MSAGLLAARATPASCQHGSNAPSLCLTCGAEWCAECDPSPAALCHYCAGRGYSTAEWSPPTPVGSKCIKLTVYVHVDRDEDPSSWDVAEALQPGVMGWDWTEVRCDGDN